MLYSVGAGGKRLRPALMFASYEMFGGRAADILDAACAVEMIHTYSLVHDDLPAMDDDDLRRGKPTNHKVFGEALAILAGDGLLTDAFSLLLSGNKKIRPENRLKAAEILSFRAGAAGMVSGQAADLEAENFQAMKISRKKLPGLLNYIHRHKTADMIMASMEMGCALSGRFKCLPKISSFAEKVGLCFQAVDDILDVTADKKKLGKSGSDSKNKKLTFVSLYGLEKAKKMADKYAAEALEILDSVKCGDPVKKRALRELAVFSLRRDR